MASKFGNLHLLKEANLFVANLSWLTGQNELKKHFIKFGPILNTTVIFDKDTGLSKGYGFVLFEKNKSLQAALEEPDHFIDGRKTVLLLRNKTKKD